MPTPAPIKLVRATDEGAVCGASKLRLREFFYILLHTHIHTRTHKIDTHGPRRPTPAPIKPVRAAEEGAVCGASKLRLREFGRM